MRGKGEYVCRTLGVSIYDFPSKRPKKKAICPKASSCEFDDCRCFTRHNMSAQCRRDIKDSCPTCIPVSTDKEKRKYSCDTDHKRIAGKINQEKGARSVKEIP